MLLQGPSVFTHLGGHVAISASLPSGRGSLLAVREKLMSLLSAAGVLPSIDCDFGCVCPTVRHMNEGACRSRPNTIYVVSVSTTVDISPWSMPLPGSSFGVNAAFLRARADLRVLLWFLQSKV